MQVTKLGRAAVLVTLLAAAGMAAACGSDGTGPEQGKQLALAGGDSSGGGGSGGGGDLGNNPVGDTVIPDTAPPPPPPPPTCNQGNLAVLEGTVASYIPGMDSTKTPRIKDVTVQVYRFTGDSVNGVAQLELVATETTNGSGKFQVKDLQIGLYNVVFTPPAGSEYRVTTSNTYIGQCGRLELLYFLIRK